MDNAETIDLTEQNPVQISDIMACRSNSEEDDLSSPYSTPLVANPPDSSAPGRNKKGLTERSASIYADGNVTADTTNIHEPLQSPTLAKQSELVSSPAASKIVKLSYDQKASDSSRPSGGPSRFLEASPNDTRSDEDASGRPTVALSQDDAASALHILFCLIESRAPLLRMRFWQKGTLKTTFQKFCDDLASEFGLAYINNVDFELSFRNVQILHHVSRNDPDEFFVMRNLFKDAMVHDREVNGTTEFHIYLEPDVIHRNVTPPATPRKIRRDELKQLSEVL